MSNNIISVLSKLEELDRDGIKTAGEALDLIRDRNDRIDELEAALKHIGRTNTDSPWALETKP